MNRLTCNIQLGGSTKQYLTWCKRNLSYDRFEESLIKQLEYRAKTRPTKIARRLACLIGLIYEEFEVSEQAFYLDIVISAFSKVEKSLKKD